MEVRDAVATLAALGSGLRESELAGLAVADVFVTRGGRQLVVRNGKGGKSRTLTLGEELRNVLREYLEWLPASGWSAVGSAPLFPSSRGGRLHRSAVWRIWQKALRAAGLPPRRLHDARHTFGTELYRRTRDLRLVQKQLGHASIETTTVYADVVGAEVAAGMDKLYRDDATEGGK